jgi:hypothetical protein
VDGSDTLLNWRLKTTRRFGGHGDRGLVSVLTNRAISLTAIRELADVMRGIRSENWRDSQYAQSL